LAGELMNGLSPTPEDESKGQIQASEAFSEAGRRNKNGRKRSSLAVASKITVIGAVVTFGLFMFFSLWPGSAGFCLAVSTGYIAMLLCAVAVLLGISAVIAIFLSKELIGYACAIKAIVVAAACWLLFPMVFYPWFNNKRDEHWRKEWGGLDRLEQLGKSVIEYSKDHNGYMPAVNQWCDLLMDYDKRLSRDDFKRPLLKHSACNFAFNKNLDGLRLSDIPGEVVLLFEADGDWNLGGTAELLKQRKGLDVYVFLVNGESYRYDFAVGGIRKWDHQSQKVLVDPLRWKL
jgi:hypothetical protein